MPHMDGIGLPPSECDAIRLAAPMHDIGKIGIPDSILRKPGRLTEAEQAVMREHTRIGYELLHDSPSHYLQLAASIALHHHEKVDGSGYPHGLRGDRIPIEGRIVAVADVFDALTSSRPYKAAWPVADAVAYLEAGVGTQFDPDCVRAFLHCLQQTDLGRGCRP
jgi:HD-GYP domain-containing protein (c-di-GMP phosphodiesterase class II)